jgi:hypothetical protein
MVTRRQIVDTARSYVGLAYHPSLPSRGLLLAVADRLGLPSGVSLRAKLKQDMLPGDVVVVRITRTQLQNAIVTRHPNGDVCLVRPDHRSGKVVEHILDQNFQDRIFRVFELSEGLDEQEGKL